MSKRRGLSRDEKKDTIIAIFRETKEPYAIQDIEKVASKRGVVQQTVKDVVQELVADGEVLSDRIGVTTFYWSFPSEAINKRKRDIDKYEGEIANAKKRKVELDSSFLELQKGREPSNERDERMKEINGLNEDMGKMKEELKVHAENDPAVLDAMAADIKSATEASNRWTDNILTLRSWALNKFSIDRVEFDKNFGIPTEFDYVDFK